MEIGLKLHSETITEAFSGEAWQEFSSFEGLEFVSGRQGGLIEGQFERFSSRITSLSCKEVMFKASGFCCWLICITLESRGSDEDLWKNFKNLRQFCMHFTIYLNSRMEGKWKEEGTGLLGFIYVSEEIYLQRGGLGGQRLMDVLRGLCPGTCL